MYLREYESTGAYLAKQREKTLKPEVIAGSRARWLKDLARFGEWFTCLNGEVPVGSSSICLGARSGAEVSAMHAAEYRSIGIDLVAQLPHVIQGDFHDIPFPANLFDLVYSNSVDHVLWLYVFLCEIRRVLKSPGWILFHLALGAFGEYTSLRLDSPEEVIEKLPGFSVVHQRSFDPRAGGLNFELLMRSGDAHATSN